MPSKRDINGSKNPNWKGGLVEYECEYCGKMSKEKPSAGKKRFCSLTCANKYQKKNPYNRGPKKEKVKITCKYCGEIFSVLPSRVSKRKFCSKTCHYSWRSDRLKGKNNHNWHNGASKESYPADYYIMRDLVIQRDGSDCQNPICKHDTPHINVHHINYKKNCCSLKNLITLCVSCNGRANFNRDWWTKHFRNVLSKKYGYIYRDLKTQKGGL